MKRRDTVVINGKRYWAHVVEAAKMIRKMRKEARTREELVSIDMRIKRSCKMFKSFEEVLAYGDRLDDVSI